MENYARPTRVDAALRDARARLGSADAEILLASALGVARGWLYSHGDEPMPAQAAERFGQWLDRRAAGEPVAYIVGSRGFWRFDLQVTPATLIPRADTERLVELALELLPAGVAVRIADLGTGSGAIALALASERPLAQVVATDASDAALAVARDNARRLRLANVEFRSGSWLAALADVPGDYGVPAAPCGFDLIASNPPYIAENDPHLQRGDLRSEPRSALASGPDGLDDLRVLARDAPAYLKPGGWLLLEHGHEQGPAVRSLLGDAQLVDVRTVHDLEQRERVTLGRSPPTGRQHDGR